MGNHCIDCKFCGKDQRIYGDNCCDEYVAEKKARDVAKQTKIKEDLEYLSKFGLHSYSDYYGNYNLSIHKVADALRKLKI